MTFTKRNRGAALLAALCIGASGAGLVQLATATPAERCTALTYDATYSGMQDEWDAYRAAGWFVAPGHADNVLYNPATCK